MDDKNNDRPAIEITPEMLQAGIKAFSLWNPIEDRIAWIVEDVFEDMLSVAIVQGLLTASMSTQAHEGARPPVQAQE